MEFKIPSHGAKVPTTDYHLLNFMLLDTSIKCSYHLHLLSATTLTQLEENDVIECSRDCTSSSIPPRFCCYFLQNCRLKFSLFSFFLSFFNLVLNAMKSEILHVWQF